MKHRSAISRILLLFFIGFVCLSGTGIVMGASQHPALNLSNQVLKPGDLIRNSQAIGAAQGTENTVTSQNAAGFFPVFQTSNNLTFNQQKAVVPMVNFTDSPDYAKPLNLHVWSTSGSGLLAGFLDSSYKTGIASIVLPGSTKKPVNAGDTGKNVIEANNRFAFELYSNLDNSGANTGKNIFFSPFSISTALALAYEGARGSTADQIQAVFHFPTDNTTRRSEYSAIIAGLNEGNSGYTLNTANALWAEKTYSFLPEYKQIAENYYDANVRNLDFIHQPEQSRSIINSWVADKTNNKIKDLLPAGSIDPETRLVITNAIYFKGTWVKQFDKDLTQDAQFEVAPGQSVTVPMMQRTDEDAVFNYTETNGMQVLDMPYTSKGGKNLSMLVILPKGESLDIVESALAGSGLSGLENTLTSQRVIVYFPKFKIETQYSLSKNLQSMGMPVAFSDDADFSGMDGTKNLEISDVIHKAYIDVNEEGTEAAASTGVIINAKGINVPENPVPVFNADHPFIFFIQDRDTGTILFMGRVMNPNT